MGNMRIKRNKKGKLAHCLLGLLLDGEWHKIGDLFPYLSPKIDPTVAVKCYTTQRDRHRNGEKPNSLNRKPDRSIPDQIQLGRHRIVKQCVGAQVLGGALEIVRDPGGSMNESLIKLSKSGFEMVAGLKHGSQTANGVWNELRRAYLEGKIQISVFPKSIDPTEVPNQHSDKSEQEKPKEQSAQQTSLVLFGEYE